MDSDEYHASKQDVSIYSAHNCRCLHLAIITQGRQLKMAREEPVRRSFGKDMTVNGALEYVCVSADFPRNPRRLTASDWFL